MEENEQKADEGTEPKAPEGNTGEGDKAPEESLYDKTERLVERAEAANKRTEELQLKADQAAAKKLLAGKSVLGGGNEVKKKETPAEYTTRIQDGEGN